MRSSMGDLNKAKKHTSSTAAAQLVPVTLMLAREDRDALQQEALNLRLQGKANRIDVSAIVRRMIAEWRIAR